MKSYRRVAWTGILLACWLNLVSHAASADVLYDHTNLVTGPSMIVDTLNLSSAGTVTVKLTDMGFPSLLSTLSFVLTSATGEYAPARSLDTKSGQTSGSWDMSVSAPITLYAAIYAAPNTQSGFKAGMYNVQISFSPQTAPVPVPAALWLLLSGIVGLAGLRPKLKLSQSFGGMSAV